MTPSQCPVEVPSIAGTRFERLVGLDPDEVRCPFPAYAELREERPVAWSEPMNCWIVTRYADIRQVVGDPVTFSSAQASGTSSVTSLARRVMDDARFSATTRAQAARRLRLSESPALLNCDPPHHKRQRGLVQAAFTRRRVLDLEDGIEQLAHDLIGTFAGRGHADLVTEFTMPLPMTVIAMLLGVPPERMHEFKTWSDSFTKGVGAMNLTDDEIADMFQKVDDFYNYFGEQLELRRTQPSDDLLTGLVDARFEDDEPLTNDECLQMLVQFLVGGNETTTNLIGSVMLRMVDDPSLMSAVRADRNLITGLIEEVLRLHSPVQGLFRTATVATDIGGQAIAAGDMVFSCYGSANRDHAKFENPDALDPGRGKVTGHLAFGHGEHGCLGANLARSEARIAVNALLSRLDDIELVPDAEVPRHRSFVLHGAASVPLTFRPADV